MMMSSASALHSSHYSTQEGQEDTQAEKEMAPGETHLFSEISENMGTWTAVRKISHIKLGITFIKHSFILIYIKCIELRVAMWWWRGLLVTTVRVFTAVSTTNSRQITASLFTRENENLSLLLPEMFKVPSGNLNSDLQ